MGNIMAGTACLIFIMDRCTVRLSVTLLTGHQLPMIRMAFGTGQGRMLSLLDCQLIVRICVATTTDFLILVKGIRYLQRCMYRMAGETVGGGHLHCRTV